MSHGVEPYLHLMTGGLGLVVGVLAISFARPGTDKPTGASTSASLKDENEYEHADTDTSLLTQLTWPSYENLSPSMKAAVEPALLEDVLSTEGITLNEGDASRLLREYPSLRGILLEGWMKGCFRTLRECDPYLALVKQGTQAVARQPSASLNNWDRPNLCQDYEMASVVSSAVNASVSIVGGSFTQVAGNQIIYTSNEHSRIAYWLSGFDYWTIHHQVAEKRTPNTGRWMLECREYYTWITDPRLRLMWCTGIPGVGKTTIASLIIDVLREQRQHSTSVTFVYFSHLHQSRQNLASILRTLLRQIYEFSHGTSSASAIEALYKTHMEHNSQPSEFELRESLATSLRFYKRAYVVLDAIDEYLEIYDGLKVRKLMDTILSLGRHVKLMVTSRVIGSMLGISLELEAIRKEIDPSCEDMAQYIRSRIAETMGRFEITERQLEQIMSRVMYLAQGRFLIAELHMNILVQQISFGDLEDALRELPEEIDSTYSQIMERIDRYPKPLRELARKTLMWITCSHRKISVGELQHALAMRPRRGDVNEYITSIESITSACSGLLLARGERIVFVHISAQEFFKKTRSFYFPNADEDIFKTCIAYLTLPMCLGAFEPSSPNSPRSAPCKNNGYGIPCSLYNYAATNLGHHSQASQYLQKGLSLFLLRDNVAINYCCAYIVSAILRDRWDSSLQTYVAGGSSVFLAIFYNQDQVLPHLLDGLTGIPKTERGRTPLLLAAQVGEPQTVKALLDWSNGNRSPPGNHFQPPRTAVIGYAAAADRYGRTALSYAASSGKLEVLTLLLQQPDVNINMPDNDGKTPLAYAAWYGHASIVECLLWHPMINVNLANHQSTIDWLLRYDGVCEDWPRNMPVGRTPLSYAAERGHQEVVVLLLHHPYIKVNLPDETGRTPLSYAVENGFSHMVELMMNHSMLEVNCWDAALRTPLIRAAMGGSIQIVRSLLERVDIDLNAQDMVGQTALSHAVQGGHEIIVRALLRENGVDIDLPDANDRTPLSYATGCKDAIILELLLGEDFTDVNAADKNGRTPLSYAAQNGHITMVEQLLQRKDIQVDLPDISGDNPLSYAVQEGHFTIAQMLLHKGERQVNWARGRNGRTLLSYASENGHFEMVLLLLNQFEVDVNLADRFQQTPLSYAAQCGHKDVVKLLLSRPDVNPNIPDEKGRTPLSLAVQLPSYPWWAEDAELWMLSIVELFCTREDVDLNKADVHDHTPAFYASRKGFGRVSQFLNGRGALQH